MRRIPLLMLVVVGVLVSLVGTGVASSLTGPRDIKDDAIRRRHINEGAIRKRHLAQSLYRRLRVPGPQGPQGEVGPQGPEEDLGYQHSQ